MPLNAWTMTCGLLRNAHSDDVVIIAAPPHSDQAVIALNVAAGITPL